MFNDTNAFANLLTGPGLYRVWILANQAKSAPLVSIWIDPQMRVFEPQMKAESNLPLASIPASGRPDGQAPEEQAPAEENGAGSSRAALWSHGLLPR